MDYLIGKHERDAAERPGTRARAQAAIAFVELAQRMEAGVTATEHQLELIRAMDKPTAKTFLRGIRQILKSLETLDPAIISTVEAPVPIGLTVQTLQLTRPIDFEASNPSVTGLMPEAIEAPQVTSEPVLEAQSIDVDMLPERISQVETPASVAAERADVEVPDKILLSLSELDAIQDTPEAVEWVFNLAREVLEDAEVLEGEQLNVQNDTAIPRLKSFLTAIHETQKTVPAVDDAYLLSQMTKYIDAAQTLMSSRIINAACTYAYLKGAPLEYIALLRSATKSGAKAADVHNSIAAVKQGILRANRKVREGSVDVVSPHGESAVGLDEAHVELAPPVVNSGIAGVDAPERVDSDDKPSDSTDVHDLGIKVAVSAQPISSKNLAMDRPTELLPVQSPIVASLEPTKLAPSTVPRSGNITLERRSLGDVRKVVLGFMLNRGIDEKMAMALLDYRRTLFSPEQAKEILLLRRLFGVEDVRPTSDKLFQVFSQQKSLTPGQNKRLAWYAGFRVHRNGDGTKVLQPETPHPVGWIRNAAKNTDGPDQAEKDLLAALEKLFGYLQENQS